MARPRSDLFPRTETARNCGAQKWACARAPARSKVAGQRFDFFPGPAFGRFSRNYSYQSGGSPRTRVPAPPRARVPAKQQYWRGGGEGERIQRGDRGPIFFPRAGTALFGKCVRATPPRSLEKECWHFILLFIFCRGQPSAQFVWPNKRPGEKK